MAPVPFHGNVEEEDSDDEDPRNDVEGEGPGMHELVSDTEEEDNKESVSDGKCLVCLLQIITFLF